MSESTARHTPDLTLSILRNPYGWHANEVKAVRLEAADLIEALTAQVSELRAALEKYGTHLMQCQSTECGHAEYKQTWKPCDCGFDAALASTEK